MIALQATEERLGVIDGLLYADGFDCALTLEELRRYSRIAITEAELSRMLREDSGLRELVAERAGLYCLADRLELLDARPTRIHRARRLRRRAERVAAVLRHVPFVRGAMLTGSTAAGDATREADVDLMVVVAQGRLGSAFLLLGTASRILGRRLFCPNFYVAEGDLAMTPRSLYVAHEIVQARPLIGASLLAENPWVGEWLPNAMAADDAEARRSGSILQRLLEAPLRGRSGDRLEVLARRVALTRLGAHHRELGERVPPSVVDDLAAGRRLSFHRGARDLDATSRHAALRAQLSARL